ncbi:ABC transporter permease [Ktedonobacteria bacterium brp13]|nr:ABC transporter permease [Ktedonobacteria bacterium brp13]
MHGTLIGQTQTLLALELLGLLGGVLLVILAMGGRNPFLLHLGWRNTLRRPGRTATMLAGLMLSTAFITVILGLQDSFRNSQVSDRLAKVGSVDEVVTGPFTQDQVAQALTRLHTLPEVQASTALYVHGITVTSSQSGMVLPQSFLYAVPSDFDQVFGPITDTSGRRQQFQVLNDGAVLLSRTAAESAHIRPGDQLQIKLDTYAGTLTVTVRAVLSTDLVLTSSELAINSTQSEVILSFSALQQQFEQRYHLPLVPNMLCVKNVGTGGLDDSGPNDVRSQAVLSALQSIFGVSPENLSSLTPTDLTHVSIHPLKPTVVESMGGTSSLFPLVSNKWELIVSPAARQLTYLLPAFSSMLVGAGLLLQILLWLLLAAERRTELGMCRAIGLQRSHLLLALLIEGCCYSIAATVLGLLLGIGATTLELSLLTQAPTLVDPFVTVQAGHIPLALSVNWQSICFAGGLSILVSVLVIGISAAWISRMDIVAALRDLDSPSTRRIPLLVLLRHLHTEVRDNRGLLIPETPQRRHARYCETLVRLIWELCVRGPLCLLIGSGLYEQGVRLGDAATWMQLSGLALVIASAGLFIRWGGELLHVSPEVGRWLCLNCIGTGWLVLGLRMAQDFLLLVFAPMASALDSPFFSRAGDPSILECALYLLLPLMGSVLIVVGNSGLLAYLLSQLLRLIRRLAPLSRTALAYPLTFRFRSGVTILLLSLIAFLIQLLIINNVGTIQQSQVQVTTGNFQLELAVNGGQSDQRLEQQVLATPDSLRQDIAAVARFHFLYAPDSAAQIQLPFPGNPIYSAQEPPLVMDDTYLSLTTMPFYARAQGYTSDRQVWDALREHPGYAVLQYRAGEGLPGASGFTPFTIDITAQNVAQTLHQQLTIIGIMSSNIHWSTVLLSSRTAGNVSPASSSENAFYYFRLQSGVSVDQATGDLERALQLNATDASLTVLDQSERNAYTTNLTLFLSSYLAVGLLFGAFSIGVVASRAVVERRQQIGLLRALGFSQRLVRYSFILESSFLILLSLLTGFALAAFIVYWVDRTLDQTIALPFGFIGLILLGCYLIALGCTGLSIHHVSRISAAEALRYE